MKWTMPFLLLATLILSTCIPLSAPTSTPATSVPILSTDTPAVVLKPTHIPSLIPTSITTPTPALIPSPSPTPICASFGTILQGASLELYGNFNTMGVILTIPSSIQVNSDLSTIVEYRTDNQTFRIGFPLSHVSVHRFVGSIFWLEPGRQYDVRVSLVSPGSPLHCMFLQGSSSTREEISLPEPTTTYIISPDGQGSSCTLEMPCALQEGIRQVRPGETIELRGGIYYSGDIHLPRSGEKGAPIIIKSYLDEQAILDGADPSSFSWDSVGNGMYSTRIKNQDINLVALDGKRLYPYKNMKDLEELKWNISGFTIRGSNLYIKLLDGANPSNNSIIISMRKTAFSIVDRKYVYLENLTFRHYSQRSRWRQGAVYIQNSSDNLLQDNTFYLNDVGIAIIEKSHRNLIQGNVFYDTIFEWSWDAVYDDTKLVQNGGIRFHSEDKNAIPRGNVIRRNIFHDLFLAT